MKAYKGFNKDLTCRGFQYKEGETFHEDKAELCNSGFHACEDPLDCFGYYAPGSSVYHEVELDEVSPERDSDDTKVVAKTIKIGAALDVAGICKAHFEFVNARCKKVDGKVAGDREAVAVGDQTSASAGESGSASAGNYGSASAGFRGSASAGFRGSASAGNYGSASAGESGSASAGNYGSAVSHGSVTVGKNGCALVRGNGIMVRGDLGAVLVLCLEKEENYDVECVKQIVIDGETYKPGTWYTLTKAGEIEEVQR